MWNKVALGFESGLKNVAKVRERELANFDVVLYMDERWEC